MYAPDDLNAHFHVGIIGKDGKVLFSTKADGPSMKDSIPDGHGYLLPVPVAWLLPNAAPAEVQFVVIETGEVFPKEAKSFPGERLRKSLGGYAGSGESIKKSLSYATAEVLAMAERGDATVVLGTHELTRTGAPLILLEIARQVRRRYQKEIVLLCEGPSDVLQAELAAVTARSAAAAMEAEVAALQVDLFLALGGGWTGA